MGGALSRPKQPTAPYSQYAPPGGAYSPPGGAYPPSGGAYPPYNISRPGSPNMSGPGGPSSLNPKQLKQLEQANRTIQNLQGQMQRGGGYGAPPYGGPPIMNPPSPIPYGNAPNASQPQSYSPPSPLLQRITGQAPYAYQQQQSPFGPAGYRDSDYAAVANISGLNPADIALLHKEYLNLTRGGLNKIDRVVFRQLLREALLEANNENVDRAIENIFISIDRNRDGFIDFPEFVGAFRDVLRSGTPDTQSYMAQYGLSDIINQQARANSAYVCQPITPTQQPQVISLASPATQQTPFVYNGSSPLVISLDSNQSPYICNTQGQAITAQATPLQCIPLPIT